MARRATAKKAARKKTTSKKAVRKSAGKKALAKAARKKTAAKKATPKKAAAKKPAAKMGAAKKGAAKKATVRKVAPKKAARKSAAKKTAARKTAARKTATKKPAAKKAVRKTVSKPAAKATAKPYRKPVPAKAAPPAPAATKKLLASARVAAPRKPASAVAPAPRAKVAKPKPAPIAAARTPVPAHAETSAKPKAMAKLRKSAKRGIAVKGGTDARGAEILSTEALVFLEGLHRSFNGRRLTLLAARMERQKLFDAGQLPDFLPETAEIRAGDWKIAPVPPDLHDRRVEITGPVDRKMIVNALNSGAKVFMADFEDASSPTFANMVEGQINLKDRWAGTIDFIDPGNGKAYVLGHEPAVLMVRPRGWHLPEAHVEVDGEAMSGSLFDFGLYAFHNAKVIVDKGATPAFYLPKLENHKEAALWDDVFSHTEKALGLPHGTMKATILIETLPAAFEMDEILHAMRDHIVGLNCGRWDYIFSFIKRLGKNPRFLTPDRSLMVMGKAFLSAYARLLVKTCHRRGAFAMGGMAAQIPVKNDAQANDEAFAKVKADKEREAGLGHDGTWVAHPDLVPVAREVFDRLMPRDNQLDNLRKDISIGQADLLEMHTGARTEHGLRENIRVGVQYIEAWLRGRGAVPLYNLMEDAATAEISRAQIWQWLHHGARLDDGRQVTPGLFREIMADELARVRDAVGHFAYDHGRFGEAAQLFADMSLAESFEEFLTVPAYRLLG